MGKGNGEALNIGTSAIVGNIGNIKGSVEFGKTGERFIENSSESFIEVVDRFEVEDMEDYRKTAHDLFDLHSKVIHRREKSCCQF